MKEPYYQEDGITLYCGDCREILPGLLGSVDLLLTDPPYGHGRRLAGGTWGQRESWDEMTNQELSSWVVNFKKAIVWGGQFYDFPRNRGWLIWYKRDHATSMSDAELAWTNLDINTKLFDWTIAATNAERVGHPTQKPIALMKWCIELAEDVETILDPFCGSGTTLVAAKQLGRKAVGIEISEKYCDIAVKRLAQKELKFL